MLPAVAAGKLAEYADAFVDANAFTIDEARAVLSAAREHGLGPQSPAVCGAERADEPPGSGIRRIGREGKRKREAAGGVESGHDPSGLPLRRTTQVVEQARPISIVKLTQR